MSYWLTPDKFKADCVKDNHMYTDIFMKFYEYMNFVRV